jgi:hypothetical protein
MSTAMRFGGIVALVLAGGCLDLKIQMGVMSLNPILTDSTTVVDSGLVGTWDCGEEEREDCFGDSWQFTLADTTYTVTVTGAADSGDSAKPPEVMFARLTRIRGFDYIDLVQHEDRDQALMVTLHLSFRVERRGDSLALATLLPSLFEDSTALRDAPHSRMQWEEVTVLTGSTDELRTWIEQRFEADSFMTADSKRVELWRRHFVRRGGKAAEAMAVTVPRTGFR